MIPRAARAGARLSADHDVLGIASCARWPALAAALGPKTSFGLGFRSDFRFALAMESTLAWDRRLARVQELYYRSADAHEKGVCCSGSYDGLWPLLLYRDAALVGWI